MVSPKSLQSVHVLIIGYPDPDPVIFSDTSRFIVTSSQTIPRDIRNLLQGQVNIILTAQLEICRQLVAKGLICPIFVLLDEINPEIRKAVFDAGATDYLLSPISGSEFDARVAPFLQNARNTEEEHEAHFLQVIDRASDGVLLLQEEQIIYVNEAAQQLLGESKEALHGKPLWAYIMPNYQKIMQVALREYQASQSSRYEIQLKNTNFGFVNVEISLSETHHEGSTRIAIFMRDITERKLIEFFVEETHHRLHAQAESLTILNQIANSLHQSLDVEELAQSAVRLATEYLAAASALFYLADHQNYEFKLMVAEGLTEEMVQPFKIMPFDRSIMREMLVEKQIIISNNALTEKNLFEASRDTIAKAEIKQIIFIPIIHRESLLGALNLGFTQIKSINDEILSTLQAIGQTLGLAVHNSQTVALLVQEIAEKEATEIALRQSEETAHTTQELLQLVLDSIPTRVFWKDRESIFLGCNRIFAQDAGFSSVESIIGKDDFDLSRFDQAALYRRDDQFVMNSGIAKINYEEQQIRPDGSHRWLETSKIPLKNSSGEIIGVLGTYSDITERKQAVFDLQKSEEMSREFQHKLEQLHQISIDLGTLEVVDDVYRRALELAHHLLGYERITIFVINGEDGTLSGAFSINEAGEVEDEQDFHYDLYDNELITSQLIREGWNIYILGDVKPFTINNNLDDQPARPYDRELMTMFSTTLSNIINDKQTAATRQQMVEQLQLLNDIDKAILVAESPHDIAQTIIPQLRKLLNADYISIIQIHESKQEFEVLAQTGETIHSNTFIYGFDNTILENAKLRDGLRYDVVELLPHSSSIIEQRLYDIGIRSYSLLPLITDAELVGVLVLGLNVVGGIPQDQLDITQNIATQLALAFRQALLSAQIQAYANDLENLVEERTTLLSLKARELEAFTYTVSHDLRSPLRAINGFAEVILEDYEEKLDDEGKYYLRRIKQNANRMGTLIDDLLHLSRVGKRELETRLIQPENTIRAIINELEADEQIGNALITIKPLPECNADPILLKQLWFNLITNAIKYSKQGEQAHIIISANKINDEVVYSIQDNGVGFDMQYADKLFGVFQRLHTESEYDGTGIGLATVSRIVERHQGRIWAEAKPNEGASFFFTLALD